MIPEPGDANRDITVSETFHLQTYDKLSDKELKQIEADDQAIQTILLEWSRHVTIVHQTKDLHTADYTKLYDFLKYNQKEVDELKAKRLAKTQDPLALMANSNNPYAFPAPHQDQSSFNQNYLQQPMPNPEDITDPTTAMNMALALMAKAFKLNYSTPTNNNQRIFLAVCRAECKESSWIRNGNLVTARAEGNAAGQNGNQIRCYNCKGVEEYDLMAAAADLDEFKEVNANCILIANLQQASPSGTQTDSTLVYDTDGSAEVHETCDDNEIFNMFNQEEQYTKLLEPILEAHQVPQNDNDVISEDTNVEQGGEIVEQHPANFEETRALYDSLYQNLATEVEKVNSVNRKLKDTNADLTTELHDLKIMKDVLKLVNKNMTNLKVVSQDIMIIVQNKSVVDTSDLQTELERTKERFKTCIIKKETKYAKLWNSWYKKCDECKYDKISYDKAYKDMQQKIEQLQAQLGDLKGKSKDTSCVSDTRNPLSQKLKNENVELEF
nr:hypothetical protein [Tanacetum cinerariifolium]